MKSLLDSFEARAALFAGGLSAALLVGAWTSQYGFGYAPCIMCYWQRYAHMAVVAASAGILFARGISGFPKRTAVVILMLLLLASAGLALYHVGVEFGVFTGPQACAAGGTETVVIDPNDPLAILDGNIKPPACSDVVWSFLGISMAGWNALLSIFGAFGVWYLGFKDRRAA